MEVEQLMMMKDEKDIPDSPYKPKERGSGSFERCVVTCKPSHAFSEEMQSFIDNQVNMPRKQWVYEVIRGERETENVLLDTPEFVFLPDTHALNDGKTINWLAVVKDRSLRTLRDLHGRHLGMLRRLRVQCTEYILANTEWKRHNIMAYFHYLPSVFQLHVHFCAPYGSYTTLDVFKVHPLDTVIGNLEMDREYYRKAVLPTVVVGNSALLGVYGLTAVNNDYRNVESPEIQPIGWK